LGVAYPLGHNSTDQFMFYLLVPRYFAEFHKQAIIHPSCPDQEGLFDLQNYPILSILRIFPVIARIFPEGGKGRSG
jgi:hypothetical protein